MSFEMIVLGGSGTYPTPTGSCAGYLLRSGGEDVWLDCGPGTFVNLQQHTDFLGIKAIVLSHLHLDHILDLYPFYFAMRFYPTEPAGFPVYAPKGAEDLLVKMFWISEDPNWRHFGGYLDFHTIADGVKEDIGPFRFRFVRSVHPVETLAMRIEGGGRTLAYTSDTGGPIDGLIDVVRDADLLIVEATFQEPDPAMAEVHLTAEEAGQLASKASASRLMLTHISPQLDPKLSIEQARRHFTGEILLATDHLSVEV